MHPQGVTVLLRVLMLDGVGLLKVCTRNYEPREYG